MPEPPALRELTLGDTPEAWAALGFAVTGSTCRIGAVALELTGAGGGVLGWTLAGEGPDALDGLPTRWTKAPAPEPGPPHPNGATRMDHLVVLTDRRERTTRALERAGAEVRRVQEEPRRQAFLWLGEPILEVVETGHPAHFQARFWGVTVSVADLEGAAERLGKAVGPVRQAAQPGRRIAVASTAAGLGVPLALMSPHVPGL